MKKHLVQHAVRFIITNIVFALVSYTFFVASNSAVPGSVDKVQGAIQITGIFLLVLNGSFLSAYGLSKILPVLRMKTLFLMMVETVIFLVLSWILILVTQ